MREINISIKLEYKNYLYYLQKRFKSKKHKVYNAIIELKDMSILSIASSEQDYVYVKRVLKRYIPEIILFIYKEKYLIQNISFNDVNEVFKLSLLKALVLFDSETDYVDIRKELDLDSDINIDSFYSFKLQKLKTRWQEIVSLANDNSNYFFESETLLELLKFLIATIKPKASFVNVYYNGKNFEFLDAKNRRIKNAILSSSGADNDEVNLIISLISLAPDTINIHCIDSLSNNTFKVLYYIFDKRVNLLV